MVDIWEKVGGNTRGLVVHIRNTKNIVQQILDNWMLCLCEYTVFMFFVPQNTKIILKFIG